MPRLAYIAAPYGAPTPEGRAENTRRAVALAALSVAWGRAPICVHPMIEAGAFGDDANPADRALGLACCMAQVEAVARSGGEMWILLRGDRSMSDGCRAEVDAWERAGGTEARIRRFLRDGDDFIEAP